MKLIYYFLFLLPLLMFSCISSNKNIDTKPSTITVHVLENSEILFSDVFDEVEYHLFRGIDSIAMGDVQRLRIANGYIGIIANTKIENQLKQTVYIFDKRVGILKITISNQGDGLEQYLLLTDISLRKDQIELLDHKGKKILIYDYNGNFKKRISIPNMSYSFYDIGNDEFWLYNNNVIDKNQHDNLVRFNSGNNEIINDFLPIDKNEATYLSLIDDLTSFISVGGQLYFQPSCMPIIYKINGDTLAKAYDVNFGKNNTPAKFYEQKFSTMKHFSNEADRLGYIYLINNYGINSSTINLSFKFNKMLYYSLYNINTGVVKSGNIIHDDLNGMNPIQLIDLNQFFAFDNDNLYFLMTTDQFRISCNDDKCLEFMKESDFEHMLSPIIVKCKLKME